MSQYFIKDKQVHKHPANCDVIYNGEKIYGTPPIGYSKCKKCFSLAIKNPEINRL